MLMWNFIKVTTYFYNECVYAVGDVQENVTVISNISRYLIILLQLLRKYDILPTN